MTKPVRIGNAQAFWGDRSDAAADMLAREPDLDYLTLDYLAEVSMSILALQRERDSAAGYPRDFLEVVRSLVPYWNSGGRCRIIANSGGLNPRGCAEACKAALEEAGCRPLKIGVVSGDDVLEKVRAAVAVPASKEFRNVDTGAAISEVADRLVTANAYLGAVPIVEALAAGADIVITGRVADPSLVLAACIHHFEWDEFDLNRLAGATVAGHLIECGTQVTGGISTDWLSVPDVAHIGFPIVEVADDGSCIVTKPRGTGGCVTEMTVKEQLVYEIGDPANYLSPDVAVSFLTLDVTDLGNDRVRVGGATGKPRPDKYKVSATYRDGFRAAGTLSLYGRDVSAKAYNCGEFVLERVREAGFVLRDSIVEVIDHNFETVLRVAVEAESRDAAERFSRELIPLVTSGPQGTTGYAEGRPRVHEIFRYWPCLIEREAVSSSVEIIATSQGAPPVKPVASPSISISPHEKRTFVSTPECPTHLRDIACARSGDKGIHANIGIIPRDNQWWDFLRTWLTAERVFEYFEILEVAAVERFELPNLNALNFILRGALRRSLRTDAQGKALGQVLLEMPLPEEAKRTKGA